MSFLKRPEPNTCPGIDYFIRPKVNYEECKSCGGRVEYWTDENKGECIDCGTVFEKGEQTPSCLEYCDYSDRCKGIIVSRKRMLKS